MKWVVFIGGGLLVLVAAVVAVGLLLPRTHKASRTLRLTRPPADVWPVLIQATEASDVPVDVLERDPPRRLVTRVTEKEKNFGGTWTITIAPTASGSDVTITEDGWVANPIFRFVSRFLIGHHATMDTLLKNVAKTLSAPATLSGE
jgi:hypothetical protein